MSTRMTLAAATLAIGVTGAALGAANCVPVTSPFAPRASAQVSAPAFAATPAVTTPDVAVPGASAPHDDDATSAASGAVVTSSTPAEFGAGLLAAVSPGYKLEFATLADRRRVPLRWNPCQTVTYKVNVAAVPAEQRSAVLAQIRVAVARLSVALRIPYSYKGTTTEVPRTTTIDKQSAELIVAVTTPSATDIRIGGDVLGYGGYHFWSWRQTTAAGRVSTGAAISRSWVVLDRTGFLDLEPGFGTGYRQGNVLLHELAHSVGLDHVSDKRQIMYPTLLATAPDGYAAGDLAGLNQLGRNAGCISVPAGTFTDLR